MTMTSSSSNEKTFSARLMVCLGQEDMTDLHLLFKDGVRVPAFRAAVLCGMLYGPFQEGASTEIRLDYRGDVLTALAPEKKESALQKISPHIISISRSFSPAIWLLL